MVFLRPSTTRWPERARRLRAILAGLALLGGALPAPAAALEITAPGPGGVRVGEGLEYSSQVLGRRWDFSEPEDLPLHLARQLDAIVLEDGVLAATSTGDDPWFYLLDPGVPSAVAIEDGDRFPIDPRRFSRLALKIRHDRPAGARLTVFWNDACRCFAPASAFGRSTVFRVPPDAWHVVLVDLPDAVQDETPWTAYDDLQSLRIDPFREAGHRFELDWVRLVPPEGEGGSEPGASFDVRWTHAGPDPGSFSILAEDPDGARLVLAAGVPGDRRARAVDIAPLAPGPWTIRVVASSGEAAASAGPLIVDAAPVPRFTVPHRRGDVSRSYAAAVLGNPWGPVDPADVERLQDLVDATYAGSVLTARSTTDDPRVLFFTPEAIDADVFTQLSFLMALSEPVVLANGEGVARIIYGPTPRAADASPTEDIVLRPGLVEYVLGDMRALPREGLLPSTWRGGIEYLRLDPHESTREKTVTVAALRVAPEHRADPLLTFDWTVADPDSPAVRTCFFLDPDEVPASGGEVPVQPCFEGPPGRRQAAVDFTGQAAPGRYRVYAESDDGRRRVTRYASGFLQLGARVGVPADVLFRSGFEAEPR